MKGAKIGELRNHLSRYLDHVRGGGEVLVLDRDRPVARIVAPLAAVEATDDRFLRRDVQTLEVWAEDAGAARRIAQQDIQSAGEYDPAWRIRQVVRGGKRKRKRT